MGIITAVLLRKYSTPLTITITLTAVALGALRYNWSQPVFDQNHIAFYNGTADVVVNGLVVKSPDIHEKYQNLTVAAESVLLEDGRLQPVQGLVRVGAWRTPVIEYGMRIQARGVLEEAENFGTFDYHQHLANRDIHAVMNRPSITEVETGAGNPLMHGLLAVCKHAQGSINQLLP